MMNIKQKILMILSISLLLSVGAYYIISNMFENIEKQLLDRCRIESKIGAKGISELMELMIKTRIISESDLFDTNYVEIPNITPKMYRTKYDHIFDKFIQRFEDEFIVNDKDLVYSLVVDKNGYAPTHNSNYSKPPKSDIAYNLKYSRAKRIFDDTVGLKAARHTGKATIEQLYSRDTGELIWDIAAPVSLQGKHWGAFRVGVSLKGINEIKNHMLLIMVMTIFIIISITLLMLFLIIPRKLLQTDYDSQAHI